MSGTALKLVALVLMLIDHIGEFIPGVPVWFRWIGRLSAPIFFFCAAQGFALTRNRQKYLLRLYAFSVGMAVVNVACNSVCNEGAAWMANDIFTTIFAFTLIIALVEYWREDKLMGTAFIIIFLAAQGIAVYYGPKLAQYGVYGTGMLVGSVLGSVKLCEGGWRWVALGLGFYATRNKKWLMAALYAAYCLYQVYELLSGSGWTVTMLLWNFQWMMIFALPIILLYNGKRGAGLKYFFYFFYPAHIVLLFFIGNSMCAAH